MVSSTSMWICMYMYRVDTSMFGHSRGWQKNGTSTGNETIEVEIEVDGQVSTLIDLRHTVQASSS
jgi:hypothetical protein